MVFNALISNTDDHPRNHAVVAMDADWKLSPAYDLAPSTPVSQDHRDPALNCGDYGRYANATNLLSQCARFLVERDEAKAIVDATESTIGKRGYEIARAEGVTQRDCDRLAGAFAYGGFRLEIAP
jgi:serine/threonine-protein kinase HipA